MQVHYSIRHSTEQTHYVLPETVVLAAIGCVDLLTTIYLIGTGQAQEGNRLMAASLNDHGPWGFVFFKFLFLAVPLAIAELARQHRPNFVRNALRVGIVLYVGLYGMAFVRNNLASADMSSVGNSATVAVGSEPQAPDVVPAPADNQVPDLSNGWQPMGEWGSTVKLL